ncbi:MAG: fibronectin type III domain-containing protein, partial [Clostridiales Family XIII bacterium]|nr:fibronectin type III domain-containing protein [Clostridiales Family XIII bacterium]
MKRRRLLSVMLAVLLVAISVPASFADNAVSRAADDTFATYLHDQFDAPETVYRPEVRWWMDAGSHTDRTLREDISSIAEMGFGAAEFLAMDSTDGQIDYSKYGWGSDEWIDDTKLIIKESTDNGLGFSLTSGTNWSNANLPDTYEIEPGVLYSPDHPSSGKEISYTTDDVASGNAYNGELPEYSLPSEISPVVTKQDLVSVVAVGIKADGTLDVEDTNVIGETSLIRTATGVGVNWTAPTTNASYRVFAIWQHGSAENNKPSVANNYTINYVDPDGAAALMKYWNEVILTPDVRELIRENGRGELYMDSLELTGHGNGGLLWGTTLLDEFEDRWGYSLEPYIPFLFNSGGRLAGGALLGFGNFDNYPISGTTGRSGNEELDRVRNDFYQVLTEIYIENVLEPLQAWLQPLGMTLRAEVSYGGEFYEIGQATKAVDKLETESLEFGAQIDAYRNFSGPAHLYGKPLSSETGAIGGSLYQAPLDTFNQMVYTQFVSGIGRTVLHVYSSQWGHEGSSEWPGYAGQSNWTERWEKRQPVSEHYQEWTAMVARYQKALRKGIPRVDIGILRNDYMQDMFLGQDNWTNKGMLTDTGLYLRDTTLQNAGYTYDYFSPLLLTDNDISYGDGVVQPDGPGYQALVVYQEELPLESARVLLQRASAGLPIVFVDGATELGRPNLMGHLGYAPPFSVQHDEAAVRPLFSTESDAALSGIIAQIKALGNVRVVDNQANIKGALAELGVYPRVQFAESNDEILTYTRKDEAQDTLYLYAYNYKPGAAAMAGWETSRAPSTVEVAIDEIGKPYELNAWTGEINPVAYQVKNGRTVMGITLAPGAATMIALNLDDEVALRVHPVVSTADRIIPYNSESNYIAADQSGSYITKLSDGREVTTRIAVPEDIVLSNWNLNVQTWTKGDWERREETKPGAGYTTYEYRYNTKKTLNRLGSLASLKPWHELGVDDSGIGTYTATFTLPADWTDKNGAKLQIGSIFRNSAVAYINGNRIALPLESLEVDITKYLKKPGQMNTVQIEVATTLQNSLGLGALQKYGMVGETKIETYTLEKLPNIIPPTTEPVTDDNGGGNAGNNADANKSPANDSVVSLSTLKIAVADKVWTGKKIASGFALSVNGRKLAAGTDYDIVGTGSNKFIGQGSVTVTGKGAYTGAKTLTFKIVPKKNSVKKVAVGKKSAKVYFKKVSSAQKVTGYQVQYRQKGTSKWKTKTVSAKKSVVTIKGLKKGKQYQFRVRAYKTVAKVKY